MDIIIIGGGKVGSKLVDCLDKEGHDVVIVDNNPEVVDHILDTFDVMGVYGSGTSHEALLEARVKKADLVIAVTAQDEINVLSCIIARKMGAGRCIARVRKPDYIKQLPFMREELGINMIVNPDFDAANEISRMLRFPAAINIDSFAKGAVELAGIRLPENSVLDGIPIKVLYSKYRVKILVCAVQRENEVIIPDGDFILHSGDQIHITGAHSQLAEFLRNLGVFKHRLKSVMIIGGSRIAQYLAQQLIDSGMRVKIIEQHMKKCEQLSEALPKAKIICGDGTKQDTLLEEGIDSTDALVSLTGIDEENIIVSLYAQTRGVEKVITKVNKFSFAKLLDSIGLDSVITPKNTTANGILRYVRAMNTASENDIRTLYKIVKNQAEAVEFLIKQPTKFTGIPLRELTLKHGLLIAAVIRKNKIMLPDGETKIEVGDTVIIVTTSPYVKNIKDILA